MPDIIRLKRSGVAGAAPASLELGEPALNYADGVIYYKNSSGAIVAFGGGDSLLRSLFVPPAPTGVTATGGNAQAAVSWAAPTGVLAQAPITDYVVQYSSNSGSSWTTFSDGTAATASATVTGLTNGTSYTFRVAAVNALGQGAWSTASAAVTPANAVFVPIPAMTSYTTPSGTVSVSSYFPVDLQPWTVFDGTNTGVWYSGRQSDGYNFPHWIQYDLGGTLSRIGGYTLRTPYISWDPRPASWTFAGSNDGVSFTTLDTRAEVPAFDTTVSYSLASPAAYSVYRWTFTSGQSSALVVIRALGLTAP